MSGGITVVGIGPGGMEHITPAARAAIERADVILGYKTYLRLIAELAPNTPREASGMRQEVARVKRAIELAQQGRRVTLVSGGDPGIYGMAGLVYEVLRERGATVAVEIVPGVAALNAAAALLGAPLMHDFAAISLSDLLTPLEDILRRVEMAARADFVLCLYNPRGQSRTEPFRRACEVLIRCRAPETPVGIVRSAYREGQQVVVVSLGELCADEGVVLQVDMATLVVVGNSRTFVYEGRMITPRGYGGRYDLSDSP